MESLEELQERRRFEDELGYAENLLEQQAQYETQANLQPSAVGAAGPDFDQAEHDQAAAFQAQYQPEVGPAFIPGATEEAEAALQDARASAPIWSPDFDSGIGVYETPLAGLEGLKEATAPLAQGVVDTTVGTLAGADWLLGKALGQEGNVLGIDVNCNTNDVDIWQDTEQNAVVNITGDSNTLDLEQLHLNNNGEHYSKVTVNGNSNSMTIDQKETGNKILFLDVDGSNNVQVDQKGTGNHFLDINLTDSHTVDVTQDGSGSHNATIHLSGNPSSVTLTQDSSTNQNYHLQQSCSSSSCSATVTQN